jgi:hypothetical protein
MLFQVSPAKEKANSNDCSGYAATDMLIAGRFVDTKCRTDTIKQGPKQGLAIDSRRLNTRFGSVAVVTGQYQGCRAPCGSVAAELSNVLSLFVYSLARGKPACFRRQPARRL